MSLSKNVSILIKKECMWRRVLSQTDQIRTYRKIFVNHLRVHPTRPCQETRAIALARVKYSASAIYRTRKILYFVDISKYRNSEVSIFFNEAHHHLVFALYNSRILGYREHCEHL